MSLRDLGRRETALVNLYTTCQLGLSPQVFYGKWNVTHQQIAKICQCSTPTVDRWFSQGTGHRAPEAVHLRRLAEMDFLLEHFWEIPVPLRHILCPGLQSDEDLSP